MSSRGQSLSVFVVQRTFKRVRRGYDPHEVDRHLELVSRWFTSTDIGLALTHERTELDRREAALSEREAQLERSVKPKQIEADATLEGARRKADDLARRSEEAFAEARAQAEKIVHDAEGRREEMLAAGKRERDELLDQARLEAEAAEVLGEARAQADAAVETAREEAGEIVTRAQREAEVT